MAIKKRSPKTDAEREAAIAAFGAGATAHEEAATSAPLAGEASPSNAAHPRGSGSGEAPATSLVRWADADLPRQVQRIARLEDRSFAKTMLLLIRRGVDAYDRD